MKSFTDISQSKVLAKILPIESADMHYNNASIKGINYVDEYGAELMDYNNAQKVLSKYLINPMFGVIPCWSLSALLNVLPKSVRLIGTPKDSYWYCEAVNANDQWYAGWESADNPIDACYNLIIRLNKLKML